MASFDPNQFLSFGSGPWWAIFLVLAFARGMDFLSTWVATPRLVLEGNPIAKKLGWHGGALVNLIFAALCAFWPMPAIMVSTMSLLVAARNFQSAWMMRSMGEYSYAAFIHERMMQVPPGLFVASILGQGALTALVGCAIIYFSWFGSVAFAIGAGVASYAVILVVFSFYALWRTRR